MSQAPETLSYWILGALAVTAGLAVFYTTVGNFGETSNTLGEKADVSSLADSIERACIDGEAPRKEIELGDNSKIEVEEDKLKLMKKKDSGSEYEKVHEEKLFDFEREEVECSAEPKILEESGFYEFKTENNRVKVEKTQ